MLLINDRHAPVDLEPGIVPVLRWRDDAGAGVGVAVSPAGHGDPVAYRVVVDASCAEVAAGRGAIWDSGWTDGDGWGGIALTGVDMTASRRYWVSLRWRYADGSESDWAEPATFGIGAGPDWQAASIWGPEIGTIDGAQQSGDAPAAAADGNDDAAAAIAAGNTDNSTDFGNAAGWAFLRGTVVLPDQPIRWATLNVTASSTRPARQFVYRVWANGQFVGVGPTFPIGNEARYDGYDVTALLQAGATNAIGAIAYTMDERRFIAQLDVCFADGSVNHYGTGADGEHGMTWKALPGPAAVYPPSASIGTQYFEAPAENVQGEAYPAGFSKPSFDDRDWVPVAVKPDFEELRATPTDKLAVAYVPPTSLLRVEQPVKHDAGVEQAAETDSADGQLLSVIADFGGARMGGIRLNLHPHEPVDLTIRYGEVLNPDGSVKYQLSAGNVYEDHWHVTPGSGPLETWGLRVFRYVEISVAQPPAAPSSWDTPSPTGLDERAAAIEEILLGSDSPTGALTAAALVYPALDGSVSGDAVAAAGEITGVRAAGRARDIDVNAGGPAASAYPGAFHSSDPALNKVWQLSAHTIEALNGNIYADSWTRERAAYEADAWIQQRAHLALDAAPSLGVYTIDYLIKNRTWPTEWPLYLVLAAHESWMRTGSTAQLADQYDGLLALLPDRYLDPATGFLVKAPGESSKTDGDLVDWPPSERDGFEFGQVNTVVNALASEVYADMADIAQVLGKADDARRFAETRDRLREAIHRYLYDDEHGAYLDGLLVSEVGADKSGNAVDGNVADAASGTSSSVGDGAAAAGVGAAADAVDSAIGANAPHDVRFTPIAHTSLHASVFALAFADVPQDRVARIGEFLRGKGMACSVYTAAPYLLGLFQNGLGVQAVPMIADRRDTHSWAYMLAQNAGGTMEAWDVARKPNTTYSHPWAASPVFLLAEGLMGVRPTEPGYRRFTVAPQPGDVREASVVVPAPTGDIRVAYRVADGRIELDVTVPSRTRADVLLPTAAYHDLTPGQHHLVG